MSENVEAITDIQIIVSLPPLSYYFHNYNFNTKFINTFLHIFIKTFAKISDFCVWRPWLVLINRECSKDASVI